MKSSAIIAMVTTLVIGAGMPAMAQNEMSTVKGIKAERMSNKDMKEFQGKMLVGFNGANYTILSLFHAPGHLHIMDTNPLSIFNGTCVHVAADGTQTVLPLC